MTPGHTVHSPHQPLKQGTLESLFKVTFRGGVVFSSADELCQPLKCLRCNSPQFKRLWMIAGSVHPSIHFPYSLSCSGLEGREGAQTLPACIIWDVGQTLDRLPTHRQKNKVIPTGNLEFPVHLTGMSLNWGRKLEETFADTRRNYKFF